MRSANPMMTAAAALALLLVGVAAGTGVFAIATAQPGGTMMVLQGVSRSVQPLQGVIGRCVKDAAMHAVENGETILIAPVGRVPIELRAAPIRSRLSLRERLTPSLAAQRRRAVRDAVEARVAAIDASVVPEGSSDVFAATAIAGDVLRQAGGPHRTLVVCDDAHVVAPALNVYRTELTNTKSRAVVRELRNSGTLADLRGVDVVFAAVGSDVVGRLRRPQELAIERLFRGPWAHGVQARSLAYGRDLTFPSR